MAQIAYIAELGGWIPPASHIPKPVRNYTFARMAQAIERSAEVENMMAKGLTKSAIASALGITRMGLHKMLQRRERPPFIQFVKAGLAILASDLEAPLPPPRDRRGRVRIVGNGIIMIPRLKSPGWTRYTLHPRPLRECGDPSGQPHDWRRGATDLLLTPPLDSWFGFPESFQRVILNHLRGPRVRLSDVVAGPRTAF